MDLGHKRREDELEDAREADDYLVPDGHGRLVGDHRQVLLALEAPDFPQGQGHGLGAHSFFEDGGEGDYVSFGRVERESLDSEQEKKTVIEKSK
jgi:hypothetical protein